MLNIVRPAASRWFCAITNPNCHARAEAELAALGYRTFVPKLRKWVSHARVRKAVYRPLLGRYLFVEVQDGKPQLGPLGGWQCFHNVRTCNGIEGLVGVAGEPAVLPEGVVEDLIRRQLSGEWDEIAKGEFPVGARVRVMEGQFENLLATVLRSRRGKLDVKLLGTALTRTVYPMNVRAA